MRENHEDQSTAEHATLGLLLWLLMTPGACLEAGPAASVHVDLPSNPGSIARLAGTLLEQRIAERSGVKFAAADKSAVRIELGLEPGIGTEGFRITDGPGGSVRILGNDERGLLYGVGKFLRDARYDLGRFTPGAWRGTSAPRCPMRGIYLATHFNNYYEAATLQEIERYVEDLSLWGYNLLALAYPHWQYAGPDDPAARAMAEHLRRIMLAGKRVGMRVTLGDALNGGFTSTPKELRCTPVPDPLGRHGNFGVNLSEQICRPPVAAPELGATAGRVRGSRPRLRDLLAL